MIQMWNQVAKHFLNKTTENVEERVKFKTSLKLNNKRKEDILKSISWFKIQIFNNDVEGSKLKIKLKNWSSHSISKRL